MQIAATTSNEPGRDVRPEAEDPKTPTLLLFHIGKTGGTSLTHYFRSLAGKSHVQSAPNDDLPLEVPDGVEFPNFISGHYVVQPWLRRLPESWRTMLVIRNPIQHLLSSFWHIRTHQRVDDNPGLCELIEATRRLDLTTLLLERARESLAMHFDNPQTRFILNKPEGPLDADDQARAIALLRAITYVGTTEHLDTFAAQVAALLPWATGWKKQVMPHAMTNPLNRLPTDEVPRVLLRHILAATEIDAEMHELARRLHAERLGSIAILPTQADPSPVARGLPVADLIRVCPVKIQNVRMGFELLINDDEIVLHPPRPDEGSAILGIEDIPLDGHSEISGHLKLAHEFAAPVLFGMALSQGATTLVSAWFKVTRARPLDVRIRFPATAGPARLEVRTEMIRGNRNDFAWATFTGLTIR